MPADSLLPITGALFIDTELDTVSIPQEYFIRLVLTRIKPPRFKFIAPRLEVPYDKVFARRQNFTRIPYHEGTMLVVLIFVASGRTIDFNIELQGLFFDYHYNEDLTLSIGTLIFTGLYSEPIVRSRFKLEEAGFRFLLPFAFRPDFSDEDRARVSDGQLVRIGSFTELFQYGCHHPFRGKHRSQRIKRLFDR